MTTESKIIFSFIIFTIGFTMIISCIIAAVDKSARVIFNEKII